MRPVLIATALMWLAVATPASAFCGFFVARGDASLFNDASRVVMARDGNRTVLTMVNDFRGPVDEFAMVIPAPTVLRREQINVGEIAPVEHLDAYTAPRLVEYHDPDPCSPLPRPQDSMAVRGAAEAGPRPERKARGVTVEAQYTVGEYDIVILSATQSDGLAAWLTTNGYRIPDGAGPVLASYIRQGMKFFVARVNLAAHAASGNRLLRPLQIAFESEKFMLPIRLGTLNAEGKQDLLLWTLTRRGRVETANYRTVRMPTGDEIPVHVRGDFGAAYRAMYDTAVRREGGAAVLMEYAWDMGWCDPCAADPLSVAELRALGVFWVGEDAGPAPRVFVTRLHARYDAESFPEDLRLIETGNRQNFQGRYVIRHPWKGPAQCQQGEAYRTTLPARFGREAETLARLTGWDLSEIRARMQAAGHSPGQSGPWWERLWNKN